MANTSNARRVAGVTTSNSDDEEDTKCKACNKEQKKPDDGEGLLLSDQHPEGNKNHRKRIWFTSIKPWITGVASSALFIMSIYQSLTFLVKFTSGPIITVTELQKVTAHDMPWITACGYPGYSPSKMDKYTEILFPDKKWTNWMGIDPRWLGELHETNVSISEFLSDVVMSPVTNETKLWLLQADGSWHLAEFPSSMWNQDGRVDITLDNPMVHESDVGQWETQLVGMYQTGLEPCTTWKPNVTFNGFQLALALNLGKDFQIEDQSIIEALPVSDDMPTFWIYATQPYKGPDMYNFVSLLDTTGYSQLQVASKEESYYQLDMEKFQMLSTDSSPCSDDVEVIKNSMQCRTSCLEATFMATTCRLPGYRIDNALPNKRMLKMPPVCRTSKDYASWYSLPWNDTGRKAFDVCQDLCLDSCTNMQYEWMDVSAARSSESPDLDKNLTGFWDETETRTLWYVVETLRKQQKVTRQQLAYDSHQLMSELGGTWGLFLGLSFVDALRFLERILLYFM